MLPLIDMEVMNKRPFYAPYEGKRIPLFCQFHGLSPNTFDTTLNSFKIPGNCGLLRSTIIDTMISCPSTNADEVSKQYLPSLSSCFSQRMNKRLRASSRLSLLSQIYRRTSWLTRKNSLIMATIVVWIFASYIHAIYSRKPKVTIWCFYYYIWCKFVNSV